MKKKSICILGSAAAEGYPALFCSCPACRKAWKNGGKDIRKRTAYKINDRVRIDFGPDSMAQEHACKLHSEKLRHLFITHPHEDHLVPMELVWRMPGFSSVPEKDILNIYGSEGAIEEIRSFFFHYHNFDGDFKKFRMNPVPLKPFEPCELPEEDQTWYPMMADHMYERRAGKPFIYAVRWGEKQFLIANDTGVFPAETWEFLKKMKFRFDLVISDCTGGLNDWEHGHMSGKFVLAVKDRLTELGCVTKSTKYYVNHFSHNCGLLHEDLEKAFNPEGIQVGYDGLEIKF